MTLDQQIFWGSVFLGACLVVQVAMVVYCSAALKHLGQRYAHSSNWFFISVMTVTTVAFVVLNHTIQVWIWAAAWIHYGVFTDWNVSLYFSMATYATVGYGDVVLNHGTRIFGTFAGVTGILAFGISTAFLVAVMTRILPSHVFGNRG
ncbi:potassium channel family protein [Phaeobacter marinintestinus]|uniref:potassium channel family protein n=1 Tax=Falsiphaeobacter marinintestinus TaxID=1492905 RepID=UPI0011B78996|nr:potassium channel family protein [Phaeobacter marinintestinus]